jgi:3',5'-cyclic AMP phosphodiesterase CpdA
MKISKILVPVSFVILLCSSTVVFSTSPQTNEVSDIITPYSSYEKPSMIQPIVTNTSVSITYPLSTVPVIIEQGGQFTLQFEAPDFDAVYAYISTAYEPVVEEFWLTLDTAWFSIDTWYINATIPSIVPEELYNVSLLLNRDDILLSAHQPRAVSVVKELSDSFSFIHITDFHVGDPRGFTESIRETLGYKSIKRCIHEINLLHPDFVIISGDLVFGQLYWKEYSKEYPKCYEMLQMFDVPTYVAPGNHDGYKRPFEDGLEFWQHYFGPLYYSFDYGDYHFMAINSYDFSAIPRLSLSFFVFSWGGSIRDEQLQWITEDLAAHEPTLSFMFMHHNPLWETKNQGFLRLKYKNREALLSLIDQYGVDMVLAGHVHFDNVTTVNNTIFITTTTPESSISREDGYWGYRLITIENGAIVSYNYKEPKYSIPSYNLKATYKNNNKATIENKLDTDIYAHLKFTLPLATYEVDHGEILMERTDGMLVELYVGVLVEQNSTLSIKVSKITNGIQH